MASLPRGLRWRSSTPFILATVAVGLFTDLFLYGLVVPVLPSMLRDRVGVAPGPEVQAQVSRLLAAYAAASLLCSLPAGWAADRASSRRLPFAAGLAALLVSTVAFALGRSLPVLLAARALQGASAAVVWTVGLSIVLDTVGPDHLGKVVGSIFSFISVGSLLAPVLGGVLYDETGYAGVFGVGVAVLFVDLAMRVLVIEKATAAGYEDASLGGGGGGGGETEDRTGGDAEDAREDGDGNGNEDGQAGEQDALLPKSHDDDDGGEDLSGYRMPENPGRLVRAFPLLVCFRDPRLLASLLVASVQAALLGAFDATVPTEAEDLLGFPPLRAGLLFVALDVPYLALGPLAGWAVDRRGTKPVTVLGFAYLAPALALLRLPRAALDADGESSKQQHTALLLFGGALALCGAGMAFISAPGVVESSAVVRRFERANLPGTFGPQGPYAQLYGLNSVFFCLGLAAGPLAAGALRRAVGYGDMNLALAGVCAATAVVAFFVIGGGPPAPAVAGLWRRRARARARRDGGGAAGREV